MQAPSCPDVRVLPGAIALNDIPPSYLTLYVSAARTCPGLPWAILAGIGKVESDHADGHLRRRRRQPRAHRAPGCAAARPGHQLIYSVGWELGGSTLGPPAKLALAWLSAGSATASRSSPRGRTIAAPLLSSR